MKTIKLKELEQYQVIGGVEEVKVLVSGKEDKRHRKTKYTAVVNKKGTPAPLMTKERGFVVADGDKYISGFYPVSEYTAARTEAKRLAAELQKDLVLKTIYEVNSERNIKGHITYLAPEEPPVYENYFVSTIPVSTEPVVDVVID